MARRSYESSSESEEDDYSSSGEEESGGLTKLLGEDVNNHARTKMERSTCAGLVRDTLLPMLRKVGIASDCEMSSSGVEYPFYRETGPGKQATFHFKIVNLAGWDNTLDAVLYRFFGVSAVGQGVWITMHSEADETASVTVDITYECLEKAFDERWAQKHRRKGSVVSATQGWATRTARRWWNGGWIPLLVCACLVYIALGVVTKRLGDPEACLAQGRAQWADYKTGAWGSVRAFAAFLYEIAFG